MKFIASSERWKSMGQPDLNSVVSLRDRKSSKFFKFRVVGINYGHKRGIQLFLQKLKSHETNTRKTRTDPTFG